jgi:lipopolysaccharide export system protein LptA
MQKSIILYLLLIFSISGLAQTSSIAGGKVEIIYAEVFSIENRGKSKVKKLVGNVQLKQENTILYCDSAYLFEETNFVEAYRNVRIKHNDSVNFYGDILKYDGHKRHARLEKNVSMVDQSTTLTCSELDFDLQANRASYVTGGKIVSGSNTLTSKYGYYYTQTKQLFFKTDVKLVGDDMQITTDTLKYHSPTKVATFFANTIIASYPDTVYTSSGTYNTEKQSGVLLKRSKVRSKENTVIADTIYYDRKKRYTKAINKLIIIDTVNKSVIVGNIAEVFGDTKTSYVTNDAVAIMFVDNDTLMIWSDTIHTQQKTAINKGDVLKAYYHVKVYKKDLQAVCDSLVYKKSDSTMILYHKPILWSDANQITGDTMVFHINNKRLDSLDIFGNAFVVSKINAQHYNQIKGKNMKAFFADSKIDYMQVFGNGQSIYYASEDSAYIGVNVIDCSEMKFKFDLGKIKSAHFITTPDATFYPLNELKPEELKLKGFRWLVRQKPSKRRLNLKLEL